jgi:hypothetical protein
MLITFSILSYDRVGEVKEKCLLLSKYKERGDGILKAVVKLKNGKVFAYNSIENHDPNEAEGPFIDVLIAGIKNKSRDSRFENITGERTFSAADIYSIELIV